MAQKRNSSIELLKVLAILIIVINHVTMSLNRVPEIGITIGAASSDIQIIFLTIFRHFGAVGNAVFMVCSSWFLIDIDKVDGKKVLRLIADVWVISIAVLSVSYLGGARPSLGEVIRSIFPTLFSNNWYVTCYILIYAGHGMLNIIVNELPQKALLLLTIVLVTLYCGFGTLSISLLYYTRLMLFITVYLLTGYLKRYMPLFCSNLKRNVSLFVVSLVVLIALIIFTNVLGLHVGIFRTKSLLWNKTGNPLIVLIAVTSFNIAKKGKLNNKFINYVSGLSLLIYLLHENLIVRNYIRPMIWAKINGIFGLRYILLSDLIFSVGIFIVALILGALYKALLQKYIFNFSDLLSDKIKLVYAEIERRIISIR